MAITRTSELTTAQIEEREAIRSADLRLVERVREGDLSSFDELVRKYRDRVYGTVYNLTSNREDAADLTQEAFIKAFQSIGKFRGQANFYTWLYRIAVNTTLSALRKNRLRRFFSFDAMDENAAPDLMAELASTSDDTEKPILMRELQEKLNEALQKLSPKHRVVTVLFEIENLSHEEISDILGVSVGTVRSRLYYAKQHLRGLLHPYLNT